MDRQSVKVKSDEIPDSRKQVRAEKANPLAEWGDEVSPTSMLPISGRSLNLTEEDRLDSRELRGNIDSEVERVRPDSEALGWTAIAVAFVSLFLWPFILGPVAAILGLIAWFTGSRTFGIWSIVIGVVSILAQGFLVPYLA